MPTAKVARSHALAWARKVWGPLGAAVRDKLDRYLIGRLEPGFLGDGIRYWGASEEGWPEALADAQARVAKGEDARGWTNGIAQ